MTDEVIPTARKLLLKVVLLRCKSLVIKGLDLNFQAELDNLFSSSKFAFPICKMEVTTSILEGWCVSSMTLYL